MTTISIRIDDDDVVRALRSVRREIRGDVKKAMESAAERHVLPRARSNAPRFIAPSLVVRASGSGARLTTRWRGKRRAIVGLLEFGGTIRTPLRPKKARALRLRDGSFVMRVDGPRRIKGKRFMTRAANQGFRRFTAQVEHDITRVIRGRMTHARTFG